MSSRPSIRSEVLRPPPISGLFGRARRDPAGRGPGGDLWNGVEFGRSHPPPGYPHFQKIWTDDGRDGGKEGIMCWLRSGPGKNPILALVTVESSDGVDLDRYARALSQAFRVLHEQCEEEWPAGRPVILRRGPHAGGAPLEDPEREPEGKCRHGTADVSAVPLSLTGVIR
ncbi:hypothetical protein NL676_034217 [Syzygium grande]|nr:hypothetical protein NL676_034217 [Syzygium grande]